MLERNRQSASAHLPAITLSLIALVLAAAYFCFAAPLISYADDISAEGQDKTLLEEIADTEAAEDTEGAGNAEDPEGTKDTEAAGSAEDPETHEGAEAADNTGSTDLAASDSSSSAARAPLSVMQDSSKESSDAASEGSSTEAAIVYPELKTASSKSSSSDTSASEETKDPENDKVKETKKTTKKFTKKTSKKKKKKKSKYWTTETHSKEISVIKSSIQDRCLESKAKTKLPKGLRLSRVIQIQNLGTKTYVVWSRIRGAKGYFLYRKTGRNGKWRLRKVMRAGSFVSFYDKRVKNGRLYSYKVVAYKRSRRAPGIKKKDFYGTRQTYFLKPSKVLKFKKLNKKVAIIKWRRNSDCDGYRIDFAGNNVFVDANDENYIVLKGKKVQKARIPIFNKKIRYTFARVFPYKKVNGNIYYARWAYTKNVRKDIDAKIIYVKHGGKRFNIRAASGQKMWGYDTTQGACFDGKYVYMNLENRYASAIKVVKMRQGKNDYKIIKVSKPIKGCHGNDITYNPHTKKLYVTYSYFNKKYVGKIRAKDLKFQGKVHIHIPRKIYGAWKGGTRGLKNINCFNGIHYDPVTKQYIMKKKEAHSMIILNKKFRPIRYMETGNRVKITNQNMQGTPEYYLRVQSDFQSKTHNYLSIFDWHGQFICHVWVHMGGELEDIYLVGNELWGSVYKKNYYSKKRGTTIVTDRVKRNGKWVYKYAKSNGRTPKQLVRDSYAFRITLF